jgi:hypothetical protein
VSSSSTSRAHEITDMQGMASVKNYGAGTGAGGMVSSAVQISPYLFHALAHGQDGVAQLGFGTVQELAPIVHLDGGLQVNAGGVSRKSHGNS